MKTNSIKSIIVITGISVILGICVFQLLSAQQSLGIAEKKIKDLEKTSVGTIGSVSIADKNKGLAPAPVIALQDHTGQEIGLKDLSPKKKKLLIFAAKDCDYCESYYPEINEFSKEYENIEVVVIKYGTTAEDNKKTIDEKAYHFKLLAGTEKTFADYQIQGTPATYLLNESNHIVEMGYLDSKEQIEELVFAI